MDSTSSTPAAAPSAPPVVSAPGAGESTTQFLLRSRHEYTVRFLTPTTNVTSFDAHMLIVAPSTPRTTTILMRSLSGALESCLIAGPGVQVQVDPFKPQLVQQDTTCAGGACLCHLNFDAAGNLVSVTADPLVQGATCTADVVGPAALHRSGRRTAGPSRSSTSSRSQAGRGRAPRTTPSRRRQRSAGSPTLSTPSAPGRGPAGRGAAGPRP